jgi:hypothetical protein
MNILFEPHVTAVLDVDVQATKIGHVKLAKIWLKHISFPYFQKDDDWNSRQKERREKMGILYKEEGR